MKRIVFTLLALLLLAIPAMAQEATSTPVRIVIETQLDPVYGVPVGEIPGDDPTCASIHALGGSKGMFYRTATRFILPEEVQAIVVQKDDNLDNHTDSAVSLVGGEEVLIGDFGGHVWYFEFCTLVEVEIEMVQFFDGSEANVRALTWPVGTPTPQPGG